MTTNNEQEQLARDPIERRRQLLFLLAWAATLLPLVVFGYLTYQAYDMQQQLQSRRSEVEELEAKRQALIEDISKLETDLQSQRESTKHYRDVADIRVQFYRESDRAVVQKALMSLGFRVDSNLGRSALIDRQPNTIAFGKLVSEPDLREIAAALIEAGFPLKRIAPAIRQPDPKLIQVYASAESDRSCGLLSVEQVRAGNTCGPM
jgi:cell division protein FtsB